MQTKSQNKSIPCPAALKVQMFFSKTRVAYKKEEASSIICLWYGAEKT